jgi:NAD(P)H-dependent FMN reductase
MIKIGIIIGSTRPGRVGESVSRWVFQIAQERKDAEFELVDIKDFNLLLLDETVPASIDLLLRGYVMTKCEFGWD